MKKFDFSDVTLPPAIPLNDPDRERKVKQWQDKIRREENWRRRRNLDLEDKK